jgi:hypothetical protein
MYGDLLRASFDNGLSQTITNGFGFGIFAIALAALGFLATGPIRRLINSNLDDNWVSEHSPFIGIEDDGSTIINRNNTRTRIWRLTGDETFLGEGEFRLQEFMMRRATIDELSTKDLQYSFFCIRDNTKPVTYEPAQHASLGAHTLFHTWHQALETRCKTHWYLVATTTKPGDDLESLIDLGSMIENRFNRYNPILLASDAEPALRPQAFIGRLFSPIGKPNAPIRDLRQLWTDRIMFNRTGTGMAFSSRGQFLFAKTMTIRSIAGGIDENVVVQLGRRPYPTIVSIHLYPLGKGVKVQTSLTLRKNQASAWSMTKEATERAFDLRKARVLGETGVSPVSLWNAHVSITVEAPTIEQLNKRCLSIINMANEYGMTIVDDGPATQASWKAQFPGFALGWPRERQLDSEQVTALIPLDAAPVGHNACDWGNRPLLRIPTIGQSVYDLNLHVGPPSSGDAKLAHALIFGMPGAGKSVFACMLINGVIGFPKCKAFAFDAGGGLKIATESFGGVYIDMNGEKVRFNPFDRPNTKVARQHIAEWIELICRIKEEDRDIRAELATVIDDAFELQPQGERSLESLVTSGIIMKNSGDCLYDRLIPWINPDTIRGRLFNAKHDALGEFQSPVTTFEMAELYNDPILAEAVVAHVSLRIEESLGRNQEQGMIFLDEASKVLSNPSAFKWYEDILRRFRKAGIAVVAANQDAESLFNTGLGPVLRVNVPTIFFVGTQSASPELIEARKLTEREKHFLSTGWNLSRPILMIRDATPDGPRQSVVLDGDLSALRNTDRGNLLRMLASDPKSKRDFDASRNGAGTVDEYETALLNYIAG